MSMELCFKSAMELSSLVRQRHVSAVELLQAHLDQIERVNPLVNAIVTLVPEHAFRLAEQIDKRIARGNDPGLLAGLPVAHKDLVETRGIRTTYGSRIFADNFPDKDDLIVERIVQAGGVTLGKTNTPEWGAGSQTFNEVFGKKILMIFQRPVAAVPVVQLLRLPHECCQSRMVVTWVDHCVIPRVSAMLSGFVPLPGVYPTRNPMAGFHSQSLAPWQERSRIVRFS